MTKVKVTKNNNHIVSVEAFGHTGYSVNGEDIVCAALSSILQTAALGIIGVAGIKAKINRDDKTGYFKMNLPEISTEKQKLEANAILNTMLMGISDLCEGYSNFIKLEVS